MGSRAWDAGRPCDLRETGARNTRLPTLFWDWVLRARATKCVMPGRIRPVPLKFHDDPPKVVPMITARSLAIVVDRMTRVLRALETVSERFLLVAAVQDGCPPAEAEAIVGYLVSRGLVFRRGTTLELTTEGRRMALDVRQWRETHVNSPVAAVTWR